jgi:hypothetical protein
MSSTPFSAGAPPGSTTVNVPAGNPVAPPAAYPFVQVLSVDGSVETALILPNNTVRFLLKMRDPNNQSSLRLAVTSSETYNTNFLLLRPASIYSEVDLQLTQDLYLYLRSDFKPFDVEVLWWTT